MYIPTAVAYHVGSAQPADSTAILLFITAIAIWYGLCQKIAGNSIAVFNAASYGFLMLYPYSGSPAGQRPDSFQS
jgi:hypothetical protein